MKRWIAPLGIAVFAISGYPRAAEQPSPQPAAIAWLELAPSELTETQHAQRQLAADAVSRLMIELQGELEAALDSGGPVAAVAVCRERAPAIAARVGEQSGVALGRTSWALRNPANAPPRWAEPLVSARVEGPTVMAGPAGELGVVQPIRLKASCEMCHGTAETIADETRAALAERYPDDRATGFREGDLRGWFWAEAPAQGHSADTEPSGVR